MNIYKPLHAFSRYIHSLFLLSRRYLPRQRCQSFNNGANGTKIGIQNIYVINLDRQPLRWRDMTRELDRITDASGRALSERAIRHSACDARASTSKSFPRDDIDPYYSLADQLFVEPQPDALPDSFDLDAPIRMSNAEIAVARSHIDVWRRFMQSEAAYALVLEDDVLFQRGFGKLVDQAWREIEKGDSDTPTIDVLYVSYKEVRFGAPKQLISKTLFRPERGLWYMSGYVVSRKGAALLLQLLPCRGPVDLWINQKFQQLEVRALRRSVVSQRLDLDSTNSYSILPMLTRIGVIDGGEALFHLRPDHTPVFAFGLPGSGLSSLAMALSMLGYRCCSDLDRIPNAELDQLLTGGPDRIFDAYVNIHALTEYLPTLKKRYPSAKFIVTDSQDNPGSDVLSKLLDADVAVLNGENDNPWHVLCEHLKLAPPHVPYPFLQDLGQRVYRQPTSYLSDPTTTKQLRHDPSPWVVQASSEWSGITVDEDKAIGGPGKKHAHFADSFSNVQPDRWILRTDTFPGNLALFRPSNAEVLPYGGLKLTVRKEPLGVREFSAAAVSSASMYHFGRFEATLQSTNVSGLVTGFFLHRDSPRQEIDIEIAGNRPDQLIVNVFYNPGSEGAKVDYGYRGTPSTIELGFDASQAPHRYAIEWDPHEIRWFVEGRIVHRRVLWNPTPIPHLPMTIHVNTWATRSRELAGSLKIRALPASSIVSQICVDATQVCYSSTTTNILQKHLEIH